MELEQIWNNVLGQMSIDLSRVNFNTWLKNSQMTGYKDGHVTVGVPNQFIKEWVEQKYQKDLLKILREIHSGVRSLEIHVLRKNYTHKKQIVSEISNNNYTNTENSTNTIQNNEYDNYNISSNNNLNKNINDAFNNKYNNNQNKNNNYSLPLENLYVNKEDGLNPKYMLESYIVGDFNNVAFAAAQSIINNPGGSYNPFFVYGPSGLGKTHLLQAIGNKIKTTHQNKKIFYTTLEKFYMDFVSATSQNKINFFKEKYRKYDVFIVDDIQFITGKEKTQDELFHIFNFMYHDNKQIIFSADTHPNMIIGLDDRIRTRFNQGMVVDINPPSFESRLAILKGKIRSLNINIEDVILEYIATNTSSSIRDLEGILNNILLQKEVRGGLTLENVKDFLKNTIKNKKSISITEVVKKVSEYYGLKDDYIYNKTRRKDIIKPRQIIMYLLREIYDISYPVIGEKLGGRDHTTVIHSYEKIKREIKTDAYLAKEIEDLQNILN